MINTSTLCFKSSISGCNKHEKTSIKNALGNRSKQSGFFDLGISLLILALSGSTVYIVERNQDEKNVSLQESTKIMASRQMENTNVNIAKADFDIPGVALQ